jgi:hypothetical protein
MSEFLRKLSACCDYPPHAPFERHLFTGQVKTSPSGNGATLIFHSYTKGDVPDHDYATVGDLSHEVLQQSTKQLKFEAENCSESTYYRLWAVLTLAVKVDPEKCKTVGMFSPTFLANGMFVGFRDILQNCELVDSESLLTSKIETSLMILKKVSKDNYELSTPRRGNTDAKATVSDAKPSGRLVNTPTVGDDTEVPSMASSAPKAIVRSVTSSPITTVGKGLSTVASSLSASTSPSQNRIRLSTASASAVINIGLGSNSKPEREPPGACASPAAQLQKANEGIRSATSSPIPTVGTSSPIPKVGNFKGLSIRSKRSKVSSIPVANSLSASTSPSQNRIQLSTASASGLGSKRKREPPGDCASPAALKTTPDREVDERSSSVVDLITKSPYFRFGDSNFGKRQPGLLASDHLANDLQILKVQARVMLQSNGLKFSDGTAFRSEEWSNKAPPWDWTWGFHPGAFLPALPWVEVPTPVISLPGRGAGQPRNLVTVGIKADGFCGPRALAAEVALLPDTSEFKTPPIFHQGEPAYLIATVCNIYALMHIGSQMSSEEFHALEWPFPGNTELAALITLFKEEIVQRLLVRCSTTYKGKTSFPLLERFADFQHRPSTHWSTWEMLICATFLKVDIIFINASVDGYSGNSARGLLQNLSSIATKLGSPLQPSGVIALNILLRLIAEDDRLVLSLVNRWKGGNTDPDVDTLNHWVALVAPEVVTENMKRNSLSGDLECPGGTTRDFRYVELTPSAMATYRSGFLNRLELDGIPIEVGRRNHEHFVHSACTHVQVTAYHVDATVGININQMPAVNDTGPKRLPVVCRFASAQARTTLVPSLTQIEIEVDGKVRYQVKVLCRGDERIRFNLRFPVMWSLSRAKAVISTVTSVMEVQLKGPVEHGFTLHVIQCIIEFLDDRKILESEFHWIQALGLTPKDRYNFQDSILARVGKEEVSRERFLSLRIPPEDVKAEKVAIVLVLVQKEREREEERETEKERD